MSIKYFASFYITNRFLSQWPNYRIILLLPVLVIPEKMRFPKSRKRTHKIEDLLSKDS